MMNVSRRSFLGSLALAVAGTSYAQAVRGLAQSNLSFGVLSDIHVVDEETAAAFQKALEYFRDRKVDAVLIAGDMADWGMGWQLQLVAKAWFAVFPGGKRPDGAPVEQLFVYGNHDLEGYRYGYVKKNTVDTPALVAEKDRISKNPGDWWTKCFHEPYAPIWMKSVKGYTFIGSHWDKWDGIHGIEAFIAQHADELKGSRPFFYTQHPQPKDTCHGAWVWGRDAGFTTRALSPFPNAVAFSGHSHHPLNEGYDVWQGAFTSIGTASLSYVCGTDGRENTAAQGKGRGPGKVMASFTHAQRMDHRHGQIVNVYDDFLEIERREFLHGDLVAPNLVVPLPAGRDKAFTWEARAAKAAAPAFAPTAKVNVAVGQRVEKDRAGHEFHPLRVTFPTALAGGRAYDYEIACEIEDADVTRIAFTKHVFSKGYCLAAERDTEDVECVLDQAEFPRTARCRLIVSPCETFGKKGPPIVSRWFRV